MDGNLSDSMLRSVDETMAYGSYTMTKRRTRKEGTHVWKRSCCTPKKNTSDTAVVFVVVFIAAFIKNKLDTLLNSAIST